VNLKDYGVKAELTVSERAGFHRYTFPKTDAAHIVLDAGHGIRENNRMGSEVEIVSDIEIVGHRKSHGFVKHKNVYFCAKFSKPFKSSGTWTDDVPKENLKEASGKYIGAFVNYETSENEPLR